eukprot:gene25389-1681_t
MRYTARRFKLHSELKEGRVHGHGHPTLGPQMDRIMGKDSEYEGVMGNWNFANGVKVGGSTWREWRNIITPKSVPATRTNDLNITTYHPLTKAQIVHYPFRDEYMMNNKKIRSIEDMLYEYFPRIPEEELITHVAKKRGVTVQEARGIQEEKKELHYTPQILDGEPREIRDP